MSFAVKLRNYRKDSDMKQEDLANRIGVSQKTISSWEVGRSEPTMKEISKLCKVFDCTVEDLTDTRVRKVGEITLEDIYTKMPELQYEELDRLIAYAKKLYDVKQEKAHLSSEIDMLSYQLEQLKKKYEEM